MNTEMELNTDVLTEIAYHADGDTLKSLCLVNKSLHHSLKQHRFWVHKYTLDYGVIPNMSTKNLQKYHSNFGVTHVHIMYELSAPVITKLEHRYKKSVIRGRYIYLLDFQNNLYKIDDHLVLKRDLVMTNVRDIEHNFVITFDGIYELYSLKLYAKFNDTTNISVGEYVIVDANHQCWSWPPYGDSHNDEFMIISPHKFKYARAQIVVDFDDVVWKIDYNFRMTKLDIKAEKYESADDFEIYLSNGELTPKCLNKSGVKDFQLYVDYRYYCQRENIYYIDTDDNLWIEFWNGEIESYGHASSFSHSLDRLVIIS